MQGLLRQTVSVFAIGAVLGVATTALADGGYQPYYYVQGAGQYAMPSPAPTSVPAPVPVVAPATAPMAVQPPITITNVQPVAVTQPVVPVVDVEPAVRPVQAASNDPLSSVNHLPSYVYNPEVDVRRPAYVTPRARDPKVASYAMPLTTLTGFQMGLQFSNYRYQEQVAGNNDFMHLKGPNFGLVMNGTKSTSSGLFWGAEVRGVYGMHDYTGGDVNLSTGAVIPSTHSNEDDWIFEPRLFVGNDYLFTDALWGHANFALAPYTGFGFRYLYNNGKGADSNGVNGYQRYSHYLYFPFGVTNRFLVTDTMRASLNIEYDYLIHGWQVSKMGDSIPGAGDIENSQKKGHGFRGSLMAEWPKWSFGPFFNYWNIGKSDIDCESSGTLCGEEPKNETLEYGIESRYRF